MSTSRYFLLLNHEVTDAVFKYKTLNAPRADADATAASVFVLVFPASQIFTALLLLLLLLTLLLRFSFILILKSRVISCISLELSVTKRNGLIKNRTLTKNEEKKVVGEISVKHVTDASAERSGVIGAKCNKKSTT